MYLNFGFSLLLVKIVAAGGGIAGGPSKSDATRPLSINPENPSGMAHGKPIQSLIATTPKSTYPSSVPGAEEVMEFANEYHYQITPLVRLQAAAIKIENEKKDNFHLIRIGGQDSLFSYKGRLYEDFAYFLHGGENWIVLRDPGKRIMDSGFPERPKVATTLFPLGSDKFKDRIGFQISLLKYLKDARKYIVPVEDATMLSGSDAGVATMAALQKPMQSLDVPIHARFTEDEKRVYCHGLIEAVRWLHGKGWFAGGINTETVWMVRDENGMGRVKLAGFNLNSPDTKLPTRSVLEKLEIQTNKAPTKDDMDQSKEWRLAGQDIDLQNVCRTLDLLFYDPKLFAVKDSVVGTIESIRQKEISLENAWPELEKRLKSSTVSSSSTKG